MTIVETQELRKSFKTRRGRLEAVSGVNLQVAEGARPGAYAKRSAT
ncbi:hypothetical protein [Ktedonosporobacter rubrisoli]|nr:hypothetical protein [Ktedonosporobacter rubrisoli]